MTGWDIYAFGDGALVPVATISTHSSEYVSVQVGANKEVYHEDEDVVCSQPIVPKVGMEFDTIQEARRVYNEYAMKLGFSIRVASSRNSNVTKELIRKEWECSHARKPALDGEDDGEENTSASTSTNDTATLVGSKKRAATAVLTTATRKRNTIKKLNCKAHMVIGLRNARWRVIVMQPDHTHPMVKAIGVRKHLRSHRSISWADYELLKTLHHRNISTPQIMGVLADFHEELGNLTFSSKDVSNMRTHLRGGLTYRDMDATLEYFQKQQAESPSFYYAMMIDDNNVVRGLFWVDGRTRELYKSFGDYVASGLSKANDKLAWLISEEEDFAKEFDYCVNRTETPEEFEMLWASIEDKYHLQENEFFQSMSVTRRMWAPAYFRKYFFPFTGTTGRSESMNSLFKKVVHPQDSMLQFITQYDYIMDTRAERENKERCKGEISDPPLWGRYAFEKQAAAFYTGEVFGKFQELLRDSTRYKVGAVESDDQGWSIQIVHPNSTRVRMVTIDKDAMSYTCSCNMFDRDGLLCPHILKGFTNRDVEKILEKKMMSLAAEACLGPEKYIVASTGIDTLVQAVRTARGSQEMQQDEASNIATGQQSKTLAVMVKNPTRTKSKGRPKEKMERFKSIVAQAKDKAMKKKEKGKKTAQKIPPCSYCFEDGHSVQTCAYMAKAEALAKDLKETELKL
nr:protein FAR-RED IMPAIRED RESPONSE 1-like [Setaria viridis]